MVTGSNPVRPTKKNERCQEGKNMVTTRKRVGIPAVASVLEKYGCKEKAQVIKDLQNLPLRKKAPPPPPGSICIRAASRKYHIATGYLSRLADAGFITVIQETKNYRYLEEKSVKAFIESDKRNKKFKFKPL